MVDLPSGLTLSLWSNVFIEHDDNWFQCPEGHFWYWDVAPELDGLQLEPGCEITRAAKSAKVPGTREEAKEFIYVLQTLEDGRLWWTGDCLTTFPTRVQISGADENAWKDWLAQKDLREFLDQFLEQAAIAADRAANCDGSFSIKIPKDKSTQEQVEAALTKNETSGESFNVSALLNGLFKK